MSKNSISFIITLCMVGIFCLSAEPSRATLPFSKVNKTGGYVLAFPRGSRSLAMGGTGCADPSQALNTYYNPANAFLLKGLHLNWGYNGWPGDIDYQDYAAFYGQSFGRDSSRIWNLGGGLRYTRLQLGDTYSRTIFNPFGIARTIDLKDYYLAFTVGGGFSTERFDVGAGLSVKPTSMGYYIPEEWFWAYDAGVLARLRVTDPEGTRIFASAGLSLLNLGGPVSLADVHFSIPDQVRAGMGLTVEMPGSADTRKRFRIDGPAATLSCAFEYQDRMYEPHVDEDGLSIGIDATFLSVISFRLGHSSDNYLPDGTTFGFGIGWELDQGRIQFDYANLPMNPFMGEDHVDSYGLSIRMDFK